VIQVAKAFAIKNHNLQNHGNYGHMTESILTTHSGPVHVAKVRMACLSEPHHISDRRFQQR